MTIVTATTVSEEFVLDSSGWLEYITADVNASRFAVYVEAETSLLVPTIVVYEVYKKLLLDRGKTFADRFTSHAFRHLIVPLDEALSLAAARISADLHLHMADAIIYATGQARNAAVVTGDDHFRGLPDVILI
jgi:predicted nucleic acid-binding protein